MRKSVGHACTAGLRLEVRAQVVKTGESLHVLVSIHVNTVRYVFSEHKPFVERNRICSIGLGTCRSLRASSLIFCVIIVNPTTKENSQSPNA